MFIAKNNDLIILAKDTREELEQALQLMVYTSIEETDIDYQLYGGEYLTEEEIAVKERKRVAMLRMTPRDFLLAITEMGVDFAKIKELMAANPQVEIELNYCNYVYRGNALLDQLCGQFGITTAQLDELFKSKGS